MLPEIVPLFLSFSTTSVSTTLFLLHFFFEFFVLPLNASCMPVFFAQAISSRQVRTMELYFTKLVKYQNLWKNTNKHFGKHSLFLKQLNRRNISEMF